MYCVNDNNNNSNKNKYILGEREKKHEPRGGIKTKTKVERALQL